MQAPSTSNSGSSAASQPSRDGDASWLDVLDAVPRGIWLVLAAGVFAAASWLQARQELDPEPLKTRTPAELAWWTYPLETNAAARLPIVTADLGDVFALEDGQHVWAVGDGGIILRTEDGGRTWQRSIARVPASSLERFPSEEQKQEPRNERMKIVVPRDRQGGRDSELVEVGFDFVRVSFLDARNGYVIDELDRILVSSDGGASWVPIVEARGNLAIVRDLVPSEASTSLLATALGAPPSALIDKPEASVDWLVGQASPATLLHLLRAVSWRASEGGSSDEQSELEILLDIASMDTPLHGRLAVESEGPATRSLVISAPESMSARLFDLAKRRVKRGYGVMQRSFAQAANDGAATTSIVAPGAVWTVTPDVFPRAARAITTVRVLAGEPSNVERRALVVAGDGGMIARSEDLGATWSVVPAPTTNDLNALAFAQHAATAADSTGWCVGTRGTLLRTTDAGATWTSCTRELGDEFESIASSDAIAARLADGSELRKGEDGTWSYAEPAHRWPAPWYWTSCLLVVGLVVQAAKRPKPRARGAPSVADELISDRPVGLDDPDTLGFQPLARGISRFLRNENTQPPLTLAITGPWGSGKSSLMRLVQENLERHGFRPVTFNAWHCQDEENLLAALVERVKQQAVPDFWSQAGLGFRLRLVWKRARKHVAVISIWLLLLSFSIGYVVGDPGRTMQAGRDLRSVLRDSIGWVTGVATTAKTIADATDPESSGDLAAGVDELVDTTAPTDGGGASAAPEAAPADSKARAETKRDTRVSLLVALVSLAGLLRGVWKSLVAFGSRAGGLFGWLSVRSVPATEAQSNTNNRFATEFAEVGEALKPFWPVVAIDDLDRCQPEKVVKVLEAVNFLVSSGPCFVLLGMERERVERAVGLAYRELVEEFVVAGTENLSLDEVEQKAKEQRVAYARHYLEKLVNIEVPVPTPKREQLDDLASGARPKDDKQAHGLLNLSSSAKKRLRRVTRSAAFAALLLGVTFGGYWLGHPLPAEVVAAERAGVAASTAGTSGSTATTPPAVSTYSPRDVGTATPSGPVWFVASSPPELGSRSWLWFLGALLAFGLWRLNSRPDPVVHDSPRFEAAARIWRRIATAENATPRAVKRFMNRVRYLAMLQRDEAEQRVEQESSPLVKWINRLLGRVDAVPSEPKTTPIDETDLVALAARDALVVQDKGVAAVASLGGMTTEVHAALQQHFKAFSGADPFDEQKVARYEAMSSGLRVD